MKITIDLPDNAQGDLIRLAAEMNLPIEKVACICLAAGCQVVSASSKDIKKSLKALFDK